MNPVTPRNSLLAILREDLFYNRSVLERAVVITYRLRHWGITRTPRWLWRTVAALLLPQEAILRAVFSGQISARATLGRRLRIPHAWGIVVHPSVTVGDDCILYHQVTLGVNEHRVPVGGPTLGNRVYVGTGAKVIGKITVGDRVNIGANAVVVEDVPPNHVAIGVPATCRPRRDRTAPPSGSPADAPARPGTAP